MTQVNLRRRFLIGSSAALGSAAILGVAVNKRFWSSQPSPQTKSRVEQTLIENSSTPLLSSIVDTLVPRDEFVGGLDLGIDARLQRQAAAQAKIQALLERLLPAVDRMAQQLHKQAFEALTVDQREALLTTLLNDPTKPLQRRDFVHLRKTVLGEYYRSHAGHASVGYRLPAGYANYHA